MSRYQQVMLKGVCLYPKLFVAEEYNGVKQWSCGCRLDEASVKRFNDAVHAVIASTAGEDKVAGLLKKFKGSRQTWPLRDLDDGTHSITSKRKEAKGAPTVIDQKRQNLAADSGKPYAGCKIAMLVTVFYYDKNGGGITTYLEGVQFVADGTPLAGGATAGQIKEKFDVIETPDDPAAEEDPFGGV